LSPLDIDLEKPYHPIYYFPLLAPLIVKSKMSKQIGIVVGTHQWAPSNNEEVGKILDVMRKHGLRNLDTARVYVSLELFTLTTRADH
jgi:hypothetical protein